MGRTALAGTIAVHARIMAALLSGWTDDVRGLAYGSMVDF